MDGLQILPLTQCLANAGLALGTTTTLTTGKAIDYTIRSKAYTKAAVTNGASPTTDIATGLGFTPIKANQGTVVVVGFDAAGNLRACQGSVAALDGAGAFALAPQFPVVPDFVCPVGYLIVKADSTASGTWTFGGSNLTGVSGVTVLPVSITQIPDRPQFN